ncbi:MAG TPA: hypothetical protein VF267_06720 [Gammaproteobacteria bacterium]
MEIPDVMNTSYYERRSSSPARHAWMINYDPERALANYHYLAAQMANRNTPGWPRVFASRQFAAIVIAENALEDVRDPHVIAWSDTFFELSRCDFLARVDDCLNRRRRFLGADLTTQHAA